MKLHQITLNKLNSPISYMATCWKSNNHRTELLHDSTQEIVSIFPVHKSTLVCAQSGISKPLQAHSRVIYDHRVQSDFSLAPKSSTPNIICINAHISTHLHTQRTQALLAQKTGPGPDKESSQLLLSKRKCLQH